MNEVQQARMRRRLKEALECEQKSVVLVVYDYDTDDLHIHHSRCIHQGIEALSAATFRLVQIERKQHD